MSEGNPGASSLAGIFQQQIQGSITANSSIPLEFGEIQEDFSLITNSFPVPVPMNGYMVCRSLLQGASGAAWAQTDISGSHYHPGGDHSHSGGEHSHAVLVPDTLRSLMPGDRVLVAWVGSDAVVIDIILPMT